LDGVENQEIEPTREVQNGTPSSRQGGMQKAPDTGVCGKKTKMPRGPQETIKRLHQDEKGCRSGGLRIGKEKKGTEDSENNWKGTLRFI